MAHAMMCGERGRALFRYPGRERASGPFTGLSPGATRENQQVPGSDDHTGRKVCQYDRGVTGKTRVLSSH
jgi:hypothetical protein